MAKLQSMSDLYQYTLRKLGSPVINIEMDISQADDRLNDAIDFFTLRHFDGVEERQIGFQVDQVVLDRGYVQVDESVVAITELFRTATRGGTSSEEFERLNFLLKDTEIFNQISGGQISNYYISMMNIALVQELLSPDPGYQFNGITHRLYINSSLEIGSIVFANVSVVVNPDEFVDIYNNEFLKKYATALMKQQWGTNIKKFQGVQMAGGMELNGQVIFDEATQEIEALETVFSLRYEAPVGLFIG